MRRSWLIIAFWFLGLGALTFLMAVHRPPPRPLARLWAVPPFEVEGVTTAGKQPLTLKDLAGHPWIADFIYTSCGGPCPMMSAKMAVLQRILPPGVRLVSFTVDPDHDTPAVLKDYAERFHADPERWMFARTTKAALSALVYEGFRVAVEEQRGAPPETRILHSTEFVLVDAKGYVRGVYNGNSETFMEGLRRDVNEVLKEPA